MDPLLEFVIMVQLRYPIRLTKAVLDVNMGSNSSHCPCDRTQLDADLCPNLLRL
jgi:hypothetical protein